MKKAINSILLVCVAIWAYGQAGELDLSFNGDGIYIQNLNGYNRAEAVAIQPDGKILVGGRLNNSDNDLLLMRLDIYGNPDFTFGVQGYTVVDYMGDDEEIQAIVVGPNGSIYTLAECDSANTQGALFSKFSSNGLLDVTFGNQGHLFVHKPNNSTTNTWHDLALHPDGSLLAVGRTNTSGVGLSGAILKVSLQGQLVPNFGTNGLIEFQNNGENVSFSSIYVFPTGEFLVFGITPQQGYNVGYLIKLTANGNFVSNFGGNGLVLISLTDAPWARDLFVKPDGKIVLTTNGYLGGWSHISLTQLESNGLLDQSFGTNGRSDIQILNGHTYASKTLLLPDGKFLLTGTASGPWNDDFAMARLHSDGSLDLSFHFDGISTKNIGGGKDFVVDAVLQSNGRAVLVGNSTISGVGNSISVARFLTGYVSNIDVEEQEKIHLSAYPNPCNQWLRIEAPEQFQEFKASIYNMQGGLVWQEFINKSESINTQNLPNGMYILSIQTSSGQVKNIKINILH